MTANDTEFSAWEFWVLAIFVAAIKIPILIAFWHKAEIRRSWLYFRAASDFALIGALLTFASDR